MTGANGDGTNRRGRKKKALTIAREKRLVKLYDMVLDGHTNQTEMAAAMNVSSSTICQDLKLLYKRIREETVRNMRDMEGRLALRIRQLERGAQKSMAGFKRSESPVMQTTTQVRKDVCVACRGTGFAAPDEWCDVCGGEGVVETEIVTQRASGSPGDSSFLKEYRMTVTELAKLEGLYPEKGEQRHVVEGRVLHAHLHRDEERENRWMGAPPELLLEALRALDKLKSGMAGPNVLEAKVSPVDNKMEEEER